MNKSYHLFILLLGILISNGIFFLIPDGSYAQNSTQPPRIFSLDKMPRVDVHIHLRNAEQVDQYIRIMDRVGIDVSIALNTVSPEVFNHAEQYNGRMLFAPRPENRGELWWTNEELNQIKADGYAGTKLWVAYSPVIAEPEFSQSIRYQGEIGLPLIGMHVANPPAAVVAIPDFEDQIEKAIQVIEENPHTTFIMAHGFWHMLEDRWLELLDGYFKKYPNMNVDLSASAQAFGFETLDLANLRSFIVKWKDRILFGTDAGVGHSDDRFYYYWYRILETDQNYLRGFFGREIDIRGLALPLDVLNHVYWANAARLIPGVHDSLINLGYSLDETKEYIPAPQITSARSEMGNRKKSAKLIVKTDKAAEVRWSFSNVPFTRMSKSQIFSSDEAQTLHEYELKPDGRKTIIYVSANDSEGHSMTTAVPVTINTGSNMDDSKPRGVKTDVAAYHVAAMDQPDAIPHEPGLRLKGLELFREVYMRFKTKLGTGIPSNPIWKIALQPNEHYAPDDIIEGRWSKNTLRAVFNIDKEIILSSDRSIGNGEWQEITVRMDLHRNLFDVRIDGEEVITNTEKTQLTGMWGDGFDSIMFKTEVKELLILTGPGAYDFSNPDGPDRMGPAVDMVFPKDGAQNIEPKSPVLIQFSEDGMGLDAQSVRVIFNDQEQIPHVLGALNRGFIAVNVPEEFTGQEVHAQVAIQDLSEPANETEFSWIFTVADKPNRAGTENKVLNLPANVDATYEVPDRLLAEGRTSYNVKSLTDGRIEPEGGSTFNWASGTGGRQSQWVEIDFKKEHKVAEVHVYPVANHGVFQTPTILIAEIWDGEEYVQAAASFSPETLGKVIIRLPATETEKIRITQPPFVSRLLWLTEIQVFEEE